MKLDTFTQKFWEIMDSNTKTGLPLHLKIGYFKYKKGELKWTPVRFAHDVNAIAPNCGSEPLLMPYYLIKMCLCVFHSLSWREWLTGEQMNLGSDQASEPSVKAPLHTMEQFSFTDHLVSATLLQADMFEQYTVAFPEDALSRILKAYPVLSGSKQKTLLSLIYCL